MSEKGISRRDFLRMGTMTAAGVALAGCAAEPEQVEVTREVEVTAEGAGPELRRISFWTPVSQSEIAGEVQYAITQQFNEEYQGDVYVEYVFTPLSSGRLGMSSLSEKLLTNIAAGTPPEAAYMDRFLVITWAAQGSLADLSDYADASGVTKDDYIEWCWLEGVWKDGLYCLPLFTDMRALYYNKEHMRELGLSGEPEDMPSGPGSLSEFDEMAEELTQQEGPRYTRLGFVPWYGMNVYNIGHIFGGRFYDYDSQTFTINAPENVEGMKWMQSYVEKFDISKTDAFMEGFGGEGAQHGFTSGQVSFQYRGNWMIAQHRRYNPELEFMTMNMPHPEGGTPYSYGGGWSVIVPKGSSAPEAAWEFISHFGNADNMHWFCQENKSIPVHKKYLDDPVYYEDPANATFMEAVPNSYSRPRVPIAAKLWTELRAELQDELIHGGGDPETLLTEVNDWANEAIKDFL